jgi:integrase
LSVNSWRIAEAGFGKLLTILQEKGSLAGCTGIGDIVTEPHLIALVEHMEASGLTTNTQINYLTGIALAARILSPKADWGWVQTGINRLRALARRSRSLVSHAGISSADLLSIGKQRFREAWGDATASDIDRAVRARDGLILALLSLRPLRRSTFARLRLGEHILFDGDDVRIHIPARQTKGGKRPYDAPWPDTLKEELFCYIDMVRPVLLAGHVAHADDPAAGSALWVSKKGTMLTADAIYRQVRKLTGQALGKAINLHKFRNRATSTLAIHEPEQINLAQAVLGHSDPRSKETYIQADQLIAVRRSHAVEDEILRRAQDLPSPTRKPVGRTDLHPVQAAEPPKWW